MKLATGTVVKNILRIVQLICHSCCVDVCVYLLIVSCAAQEAFQALVQMLVTERVQRSLARSRGTETFLQVNLQLTCHSEYLQYIVFCTMHLCR